MALAGRAQRERARGAPRPLRSLRPDLPAELEAVLSRALQKQQALRFADGDAFADDLSRIALLYLQQQPPDLGSHEALALPSIDADPGHNGRRSE